MDLNQVTLPSSNIRRSIEFYQRMGLKLIVDSAAYARFECPNGNATFSVHQVVSNSTKADQLKQSRSDSGVVIYFESDRLDLLVEELRARGIEIDHGPTDQSWRWREARLQDPDGNVLCLFHGGENRRNPPWRVQDT